MISEIPLPGGLDDLLLALPSGRSSSGASPAVCSSSASGSSERFASRLPAVGDVDELEPRVEWAASPAAAGRRPGAGRALGGEQDDGREPWEPAPHARSAEDARCVRRLVRGAAEIRPEARVPMGAEHHQVVLLDFPAGGRRSRSGLRAARSAATTGLIGQPARPPQGSLERVLVVVGAEFKARVDGGELQVRALRGKRDRLARRLRARRVPFDSTEDAVERRRHRFLPAANPKPSGRRCGRTGFPQPDRHHDPPEQQRVECPFPCAALGVPPGAGHRLRAARRRRS